MTLKDFGKPVSQVRNVSMAETLTTKFSDSQGSGKIKLYANAFANGNGYYGRFERNTIGTNALIARIQKRKAGTNELTLQQTAGFLKEEILEALAHGESVNVLDLGTMYLTLNGKCDGKKIDSGDKQPLVARFTPSQLVQSAVTDIGIKEITIAPVSPEIVSVTNQFTKDTAGNLSAGKTVLVEGLRLKISGENGGIYLCPLGEKNEPVEDESKWISCDAITRNTAKNLEFFVPDETPSGKYRILVRTFYTKGGNLTKNAKEAFSEVVMVA